MKNILYIKNRSSLDEIIFEMYVNAPDRTLKWKEFVNSLDDNIIDINVDFVRNAYEGLTITFDTEQDKMFFLLKYA